MAAPNGQRGAECVIQFEVWLGDVVGSKYGDDGGLYEWSRDERLERRRGLGVPQALLEEHFLTLYRRQKVRQLSRGNAELLIVSLVSAV